MKLFHSEASTLPNVRSIAKRAGVSITTVSRVLNNHPHVSAEARQRVLAVSKDLGYAQSVGRRLVSNIAFVYTGQSSLGSAFDSALLQGIEQGLQEEYHDLVVLDLQRARMPDESFTQMFRRKGIRGAILRTTAEAHPICERIADEEFPAIVVADRFENSNVNTVDCDAREACREAVEHLIGLGHHRIAISTNVVEDSDHSDRLAAYRQALADHKITFDPRLVFRIPASREGGMHLMRRLVTAPKRPTALFIADPLPAAGVLAEARKLGLQIPREMSVIGFDDTDLRLTLLPELTAVCQDAVALGRESVRALLTLLKRDGSVHPPFRKSLRAWLEIHNSTAAPQK